MTILLTTLKILGIILASVAGLILLILLILLLLSPFKAKLRLEYDKGIFIFRIRYLFFSFKGPGEKKEGEKPKRKKKRKPESSKDEDDRKEEAEKEKKADGEKNFFQKQISGLTFFDYLEIVKRFFRKFVMKIRIEEFKTDIHVGGDAYETAMTYGRINSALYPLLGFLNNQGVLKKANVTIVPDFLKEKSEYYAHIELSLRLVHLYIVLLSVGSYFLRRRKP